MNSQTANAALKRIGYGGKLVAHGPRSIASTALNESGFNSDVIESALAHCDKNEVRRIQPFHLSAATHKSYGLIGEFCTLCLN